MLLLAIVYPRCATAQVNTTQTVLLGRSALYYDDYITAIHYFNTALEAKPYLADAYYYRAYAKFSLDDFQSAVDDLDRAISFNPFHIEYYQLRGLNRIHVGDYQGSIDDYTRVVAELPEDQGALYNRVLCRLELQDYATADAELDIIINKWPTLTRAYLVKAQTCLALADTLRGSMWIDSLLVINQREPVAWAFKARQAYRDNILALADSCYTQAVKYDVGNIDYYLERAQVRHSLNRFNSAIADYTRVIELQPRHFVAHYNRGIIRAYVGDDNLALEDFDYVLSIEPDNTLAIYNRAELRRNTGDYRGAIADYSTLIAEFPNFLYGYSQRADCYKRIGASALASKDESRLLRANLDLAFGVSRPRSIKKMRKRTDEELAHYDQLIEEMPDSVNSFMRDFVGSREGHNAERVFLPPFRLAGLSYSVEGGAKSVYAADAAVAQVVADAQHLYDADDKVAALELLNQAASHGMRDAVVFYNIGCLESDVGTLELAEAAFSNAVEADALMAEAYYNKAVIYLLMGDEVSASPLLSKAGEMGILRAYTLLKQSKKKANK